MAGICCGVVNETEPAAPVEPSSRTSRRRRLELRPFKLVADAAVQPPTPLENGRKRQRLELFTPVPRENCEANGDESPKFGMTSVCGRRRDMEDAVSIRTSFYRKKRSVSANTHFFGVFDGHGCSHVAMKCKDRLHEIVKEELEACNEEETVEWKEAMERSYERMDKEVQGLTEKSKISSCRCELQTPQCDAVGSTAVVAVVTPDKIVVSNCGDSRAVLCRNGVAVPLSSDHKPDRPDELLRIQEAGGRVIYWEGPRVLGVLAMSRAIGDNYLKPFVIPEPEPLTWCARASELTERRLRHPDRREVTWLDRVPIRPAPTRQFCLTKLALARHSMDNVSVVVVDLRKNSQQQKP
ncbi:hypothetical protein Patl1_06445 [Pistacia atlantica]|uniref:Uncharacterized protein n=1 Tax=Pistacia atlantica TaxID=434234 RepID=A0ACC1BWV2_9ROSI|nr:hypothetical protein Patl1_06445 [Pistacia atlantica]